MSSAGAFVPEPPSAPVVAVDTDGGRGLEWEEWLDGLAGDEPVRLPRPAAEYLHEARAAGEV